MLESRVFELENNNIEIIILNLKCASIKSRNSIGILNREPLAILYLEFLQDHPFRVAPIRENFPEDILHMNFPIGLIPKTMCLYFEPWKEIERTWNPESFLNRIQWWMLETSKGTLHANDQELERPYFISKYQLLLPNSIENFKSTEKYNAILDLENNLIRTTQGSGQGNCNLINLEIDPIMHTRVFPTPQNLKELEEQFQKRSSSILNILKNEILKLTPPTGLPKFDRNNLTFILLNFLRFDSFGNLMDKPDSFGFVILKSIGELGNLLGILHLSPTDSNNFYHIGILYENEKSNNLGNNLLSDIEIEPIDIIKPLDSKFANLMSGISKDDASFSGILIGVGSLGSTLADIWSKCGWGQWKLVDNDRVSAHNVFRHLAKEKDIGRNKAELVAELMKNNFSNNQYNVFSSVEEFNISNFNEVDGGSKDVDLIVDASASNYLLRDLSNSENSPRSCSLFFNQTGSGGVLFLEDKERTKRLDFLELNYYRVLIQEEWGENFLQNNNSKVRVGASCSDLSVVLSYEKVVLLSSSLSGLLRTKLKSNDASLNVLKLDSESGNMDSYSIDLFEQRREKVRDWDIVYDTFIENKISRLRIEHLPAETGGIIIGYIDNKIKSIYIVDITESPPDSKSSTTEFVRGTDGLNEYLQKVRTRTSNNCDYIGEWHSHPVGSSSNPSQTDLTSLTEFAEIMKTDGLPILMIIIGEDIAFNIL